jgi:hypothetical protein
MPIDVNFCSGHMSIMGYGAHTGCSVTTFWLVEGAAGLVGCMVTVLAFQFSVGSLAGVDLKKLKLNIVVPSISGSGSMCIWYKGGNSVRCRIRGIENKEK